MSLRRTFCVVASALLLAGHASAGTVVFGPRTFASSAGQPQHFEETIAIDPTSRCAGKAAFFLRVQSTGVASGQVSLNGSTLLSESDFQAADPLLIEIPAQLADTNRLTVDLKGGKTTGSLVVSAVKEIEQPLGGDRKFSLASNEATFTDTLNAGSGSFVVYIANGNAGGTARVKSATLQVNGTEVIAARDFAVIRRAVALGATNTFRLSLKGNVGDFVTLSFKQVLDENACGPHIAITAPAAGATITSPILTAEGTVTGSADEGVSVNGVPALIERAHAGTDADPLRWVAEVPANAGQVTITATVTTPAGQQATATRSVTFAPDTEGMKLRPSSTAAITGDEITFQLLDVPSSARTLAADLDGDGVFEISQPVTTALPKAVYANAGLRHVAMRAIDAGGATAATADTWIGVDDIVTLDAILRARWSAFRDAFSRNDADGAAALMVPGHTRARYGDAIERLKPHLPEIATEMAVIHTSYVRGDYARYLITRNEDGADMGYSIYFLRCADGVWRIAQF